MATRWRTWCGRGILAASVAYTLTVGTLAMVLHFAADRWWGATLLLFGPRWIWGVPLTLLLPAALAWRRRALAWLGPATLLLLGPLLGFCLPWRTLLPVSEAGPGRVCVFTCNVEADNQETDRVIGAIEAAGPDIVALQEWPFGRPIPAIFRELGWSARLDGELLLASRFPIVESEALTGRQLGSGDKAAYYLLDAPMGPIHLFNVHTTSVRSGLEAVRYQRLEGRDELERNMDLRRKQSAIVGAWAAQRRGRVLLAGDFNLPVESAIYRDYWSGYIDAFSVAGLGFGYTWYSRWHGVRIDHILTGPGWKVRRCWVGPDVGSDHRPVIADLDWVGGE